MTDRNQRLVGYPREYVDRYRQAGLWGTLPLAAEFHEIAARRGDHPAVIAEDGEISYAQLDAETDRVAAGLADRGLRPGDPVIVQLGNRLSTIVAWYGLLKAGLVPVCTLAAHREYEIGAISRKVGAVAHLVDATPGKFDFIDFARRVGNGHPTMRHLLTIGDENAETGLEYHAARTDPARARERVEEIQRTIDPDDVVAFQLSGGTTGVPKVIPRLHAEYWYNARVWAEANDWREDTRLAHMIPIIHNAGITGALHAVHSVGGTLVLGVPALDSSAPLLARAGTTDAMLGHGHFGIVEHPAFDDAVASMRQIVVGGAKVPDRLFDAFERRGIWLSQTFGMSEGFFTLATPASSREARRTTVGVPISPYDEFRVLAPGTEETVPDGEAGELACRGPYTIRGYFDAPEINARSFTSDGFFRTGDLVAVRNIDGERCISMEGRLKDLISRGGEKISAEEVELLLMQHPGIARAAVVAMPDERLGERACAFLVATDAPLTMAQVQEHFAAMGAAKFKWPERLEWLDHMPTTSVGKLDKKRLERDIAVLRSPRPADETDHVPRRPEGPGH